MIKILKQKTALHRLVPVRHRYVLTKGNRLRLRYVFGTFLVTSLALIGLMGGITPSIAFAPSSYEMVDAEDHLADTGVQIASINSGADELSYDVLEPLVEDNGAAKSAETEDSSPQDEAIVWPHEQAFTLHSGDTIAGALQSRGISGAEAYRAVKAMTKIYDPRNVRSGQDISIVLDNGESGVELVSLSMKLDPIRDVVILKDENQRYQANLNKKKIILQKKAAKVKIQSSLFGSAAKAGVPSNVVANMMRLYAYEVDFQRDLRQGDEVELLYEVYETEAGDFAKFGNILYANLSVAGRDKPVYRYNHQDGSGEYYHENGKSLKRTLMRTPIDGARMSSGYGMRRHPVLGYNKMHKGVDFAAQTGTPIYAAGDGTIERIGRNGGYGNYIRIRHNNTLKTAYAHMHKFAKGMKNGKRVRQGQVIGYVGSTGRSTGPHLHFEVLKNDRHVNPKSIKSSPGNQLAGSRLKKFQAQMTAMRKDYVSLSKGLTFAKVEEQ